MARLAYEIDRGAWVAHLRDRLVDRWRPGEFDAVRWLFTGDPANPMTTTTTCTAAGCGTVVGSQTLCSRCRRALAGTGSGKEEFLTARQADRQAGGGQPPVSGIRLTGARCKVSRDGVGCGRRQISNRTGLCQAHGTDWYRVRDREAVSLRVWSTGRARPLPAREGCLVGGCPADGKLDDGLCGHHFRLWRHARIGVPSAGRETAARWAGRQLPRRLGVHQFSLTALAPTVRWELLYALQQRDAQGLKLDPSAVRGLVAVLSDVRADVTAGIETLATTPPRLVLERVSPAARHVRAYAHLLTRVIGLRFAESTGRSPTEGDMWDHLALDLAAPRPGRRPNLSSVDFTPIAQRWLRDAAKDWVATVHPDSGTLRRTLTACALASAALSLRPGGGEDQHTLTFADMTAVFGAFTRATRADGRPYTAAHRRSLWARLLAVCDHGRASGLLAGLPAAFGRHPSHAFTREEVNEDEIGKAIPETVIAQLDAHLHLLGTGGTYGRVWSPADTTAMFTAAYRVLRDTGRRPGEVVSLGVDCLELDDGQWSLVYDNHKKHRLRRRLPVTADTATGIQHWQRHRARLDLPACAQGRLFPACNQSTGPGHLTTIRLATALRRWVAAIPALHSDIPGPDGTPAPFDRTAIYPYAFRHSYAQRHADAGVGVEILMQLMDHRSMAVTQGYYTVGLNRKRDAIKVMSRYVHDRTGTQVRGPASATAYQLRSVAVPFGNCIEPSNVKAGGKQCPIRFQCAGCGFYRPDPSYLPAIEDHINALKADRETALAIDAEEFVTRNLADQATAFGHVATAMREKLAALPAAERDRVDQASALLRRARAADGISGISGISQGRTLLPLTVTRTR